ncbi:MAG: hypothetical protein COA73_13210 [Candidatus Hydrogenedentota bacterium]|nr:MAG: hypothetical protein COA73_13210 [Candidatus Hydrogenedentota bacterium]
MHSVKKIRIPSLRQCNGRGFVELNGRRMYLGPWGMGETQVAYERTIADWLANGRQFLIPKSEMTVMELTVRYMEHCKVYYRKPDGSDTGTTEIIKYALKPFLLFHSTSLVKNFGPRALKSLREYMTREKPEGLGWSRTYTNSQVRMIRRMFRWGVEEELVAPEVYQALSAVEGLKAGRSDARETAKVLPVPMLDVEAALPYLSSPVRALTQLQLLTASRGGELLGLRLVDIDMREDIWKAHLNDHKTAHKGLERVLRFGPKAKVILRPFMDNRALDAYLFSPKEAEDERHNMAQTHRRPNQAVDTPKTNRTLGERYTPHSYRRAIERACVKAKVPNWTPHRLRHTAATTIRAEFGLEAAQVVLGHATADVTQTYAERNSALANDVLTKIG